VALSSRTEVKAASHGKPCSIAKVYEAVAANKGELSELNVILYEEGNTQAQVFEYLTGDGGFTIGFQSVNKHRGKSCRCFRERPFNFCHECRYDNASCVCGGVA
jgi:hypothetical protein